MPPLWSHLQSTLAAAGLLLCLAACQPAAPSSDGAALSSAVVSVPPAPPTPPASPAVPPRLADRSDRSAPATSDSAPENLIELSQTDPRAALFAAAARDLGPSALYLRGNFLHLWAQRDFTAALAYADQLRPGAEREEMLGRLALLLAESLPADAADIVARDMAPGVARDEAAISVLHRWALLDPTAAKAWAAAFPLGPLHDRALREVAGAPVSPADGSPAP